MRNSILIIALLLISYVVLGQQVPNTTTFKIDTVVDVVNPTTDDLSDCFNDANTDYWNYYYKDQYYSDYSNLNNLLMFRDYGLHNAVMNCAPTGAGIFTSNTTTTLAIQVPPSTSNGDLLVLIVTSDNGGNVTTPTGWNFLTHNISNVHFTSATYYRVYDGSSLGNATITNSGGTSFNYWVQTFRMPGITSLTSDAGGSIGNTNVTTLTGTTNITTGDFSVVIATAHDNTSMSTTPPVITKDYTYSTGGSVSNAAFSIIVACAPLNYKKWQWYWATGADYLNVLVFKAD